MASPVPDPPVLLQRNWCVHMCPAHDLTLQEKALEVRKADDGGLHTVSDHHFF